MIFDAERMEMEARLQDQLRSGDPEEGLTADLQMFRLTSKHIELGISALKPLTGLLSHVQKQGLDKIEQEQHARQQRMADIEQEILAHGRFITALAEHQKLLN